MVSLRADEITAFETEFIGPVSLVGDDGALIVCVLAAEIVHVVEWLNTPGSVDHALLHHFVRDTADLRGCRTTVRM